MNSTANSPATDGCSGFWRSTLLLFLALRAGDLVNLVAGLWFVPKYVTQKELGAVLPLTSFATLLAIPVFAFGMSVMRESAALAARGEHARRRTLLRGAFAATGTLSLLAIIGIAIFAPHFAAKIRVDASATIAITVIAALLGCAAPVYTDALQALKHFGALGLIEISASVGKFAVLAMTMPFRPLLGYFCGLAAQPLVRVGGTLAALFGDLRREREPYFTREASQRLALTFLGALAYLVCTMYAGLQELTALRTMLSDTESAAYFLLTRLSDLVSLFSLPLLTVMFPHTADAAEKNSSTRPIVLKCCLATIVIAAAMALVYHFFGANFLALLPNGKEYLAYAKHLPLLTGISALAAIQTYFTNAEVSAGRFRFLFWFVPLHFVYAMAISRAHAENLNELLTYFAAFAVIRALCAAIRRRHSA